MKQNIYLIYNHSYNLINLLLSFLFLLLGGAIYLGFRSKDLLLYKFFSNIGFSNLLNEYRDACSYIHMPAWIYYSLPDGLWISAYFLIINVIWHNQRCLIYYFFVFIMPFLAITLEIAQYFNLCPGTFDILDLISYIIPTLILTPLKDGF